LLIFITPNLPQAETWISFCPRMAPKCHDRSLAPCHSINAYRKQDQNVALLTRAITKEDQVPDIDRAIERKKQFETNPEVHTYEEETENGEDE